MIHNLTPVPTKVYMVLEIDFIPKNSAAARGMQPVRPVWMDVRNGQIYPVFNVEQGRGGEGQLHLPERPAGGLPRAAASATSGPSTATACSSRPRATCTPAGCTPTSGCAARARGSPSRRAPARARQARKRCKARAPRGFGSNAHLFRSKANYFEPAGAVSWDVAMTGTRPDWRVKLRKGDKLWTSATYNTKRGGLVGVDGDHGRLHGRRRPGQGPVQQARRLSRQADPRPPAPRTTTTAAARPGCPTRASCRTAPGERRADRHPRLQVRGRRHEPRRAERQPAGHPAGPDGDVPQPRERRGRLYHSITSCKAPCNRKTGIAYPIADGPVQFDSGTLGSRIPAAGVDEWKTPANLRPGTYTYFCRIHPFMRGAFRVK